jgi:pantoate--beta-alanine ligase
MFAVNLNKTTMPIFYGKVALIESLKSIKTPNSTIGFCTYDGCVTSRHLSLMQQSLVENNSTVVSILSILLSLTTLKICQNIHIRTDIAK